MRPLRSALLVFAFALLAGCSSPDPVEEPPPQAAASDASPAAAAEPEPAAKPAKKRKRRRTRSGYTKRADKSKEIPAGHVYLGVLKKADLKTQVLPAVSTQAGVVIVWHGEPRSLTITLKRALPWLEAMDLICRFTDTHLVRAYTGRYELRDRYVGELNSDGIELKGGGASKGGAGGSSTKGGAGGKSSTRPKGGSSSGGGSTSSGQSSGGDAYRGTYDPATGARPPNEAKGILQGMGTRNSGPRK
mgnify:CR=1 FL=1